MLLKILLLRKRGKRGVAPLQDTLLALGYLLIIALVFLTLFYKLKTLAENPIFEETYLAADLALYVDTLLAAPVNTLAFYKQGFSLIKDLEIAVGVERGEEQYVALYPGKKQRRIVTKHLYHPNKFLTEKISFMELSKQITFAKTNNRLHAGSAEQLSQLSFSPKAVSFFNVKTEGNRNEKRLVLNIASADAAPFAIGVSGTILEHIPFEERYKQSLHAEVFVGLALSSDPVLKATIPQESLESRKLASVFINELLESQDIPYAIIPINRDFLPEGDARLLLRADVPSMHLQIPRNFPSRELAKALDSALDAYFAPSFSPLETEERTLHVVLAGNKRMVLPTEP
ncbi:hypothetical protein HYS48_05370 [Candidatus Woesearchaeota archaeon]|nr:hypothetical protein [Candidatus Woesearchaeota archaeon]